MTEAPYLNSKNDGSHPCGTHRRKFGGMHAQIALHTIAEAMDRYPQAHLDYKVAQNYVKNLVACSGTMSSKEVRRLHFEWFN